LRLQMVAAGKNMLSRVMVKYDFLVV